VKAKRDPRVAAARARVAGQLRALRLVDAAAARLLSRRIRAARLEMVASAEREVSVACRAALCVPLLEVNPETDGRV
jgi:hypothetical protein